MRIIHLKDLVTIGNIAVGILASILAMQGDVQLACYFIPLAFVFDHMGGKVAKWTGMTNRFGAELDNIADLISYSVAPTFIIYAWYKDISPVLAFIMGMLPITFGSIRFARNNVYKIKFPGFWLGFPRPVSAFFMVSFIGSHLQNIPYFHYLAIPVLILLAYANLSFFPFLAHYNRKFTFALKFFMVLAVLLLVGGLIATIITHEPYLMDAVFIEMFVYTFFTFLLLKPGELDGLPEYVKQVNKMISEDMNNGK